MEHSRQMQYSDVYDEHSSFPVIMGNNNPSTFDDTQLIRDFFPSFQYFEFRKTQRQHGGVKHRHHAPVLSSILILLWLFNFALKSVKIVNHDITLQFSEWYEVRDVIFESGNNDADYVIC